MKITKLQLECLKQLESRDLVQIDKHNWKFELLHLFVKDKTVMGLANKDLVRFTQADYSEVWMVKLSIEGREFLQEWKRKEEQKLIKAIIAQVPKELRDPKRVYLKAGK